METKQRSIVFWIIFIIIILSITILIIPKYGILSKERMKLQRTRAKNLTANLTAANAANYTLRKSNPSKGIPIKNCKEVTNIAGINLPNEYEITDQAIQPDKVAICTLQGPNGIVINFNAIGIN